ncbi:MAG: tetratricopeptide repeat-containing protein kinase family protein, partial [Planctomycetota bacterium]
HRTTDLTHSRAVVGTYRYMSPEQASGHAATVDHRSDVYCLGVTFYELLTGKRVYQGDAADTGTNRRPSVDPKSPQILNRKIERDLATIVLKSLRISPDDRYESAQALADDLKRYRRGQPIMAKPPTPSDRFSKWVIRHHQLVALLVAVGILVVAASLAATSVFARQRQQLRAALDDASDHLAASERNLRLAKSNFRQTREVLDHFGLLAADRLRGVAGAEAIRETLVRDLLLYYERFVTSAEQSPELDRELAQTHAKAGEIISEIGATSRAMKSFRSAIDLYQTQPPSDDVTYRLGVCRNHLAMLLAESGEPEKALETYVAAVDGLSSLELDDAEHLVTYARVHGNIGLLHANAGRDELAEQEYQRAIAILDGVEEPDEHCQMTVSMIWNNLGHLLQSTDLSGAIEYGDLAITTLRPLVVPSDRLDSISHTKAETYRALAMCLNNQGSMLMQVDDSEEAFSCFRESIGIFRDLVDRMPSVIRYTEELGVCYNNYGRALHRKQLPEQAEQALRRARDLMRWLAERQPNQHRYHQALEGVEQNLAMVVSGSMSVERSGSVGVDRE